MALFAEMGWSYNFLSEIDEVRDGTKILPILAIILDETDFMDAEPDWVNYLPGVKKSNALRMRYENL